MLSEIITINGKDIFNEEIINNIVKKIKKEIGITNVFFKQNLGKTVLLLKILELANIKTLFLSLESSSEMLKKRYEHITKKDSNNIVFRENWDGSFDSIETVLNKEKIKLVVIDYIQLLKIEDREFIFDIFKKIKNMNIRVIITSRVDSNKTITNYYINDCNNLILIKEQEKE